MESDTVEPISECRMVADYTLYSTIGNLPFLGKHPVLVTDFVVKFPICITYPHDNEFGRLVRIGSISVDRQTLDVQHTPHEIIDNRVGKIRENDNVDMYRWEHCF